MMARGYGRFYRLWCCHPRCDRCRFITTPWVTPPTFGFVVFDGGGENYLPFHQPHSGDFMPYANHQQIWPVEIARGAATPDAIVAASSTHHGRLPLRSVSLESTGGASNWGGSAFNTHTTINWDAADFIACGAVTPILVCTASSQHHGGLPLRSVLSESTGGGE